MPKLPFKRNRVPEKSLEKERKSFDPSNRYAAIAATTDPARYPYLVEWAKLWLRNHAPKPASLAVEKSGQLRLL